MKTKIIKKYGREILPGEKIHIGEGKFVEVSKFKRHFSSVELLSARASYFLPADEKWAVEAPPILSFPHELMVIDDGGTTRLGFTDPKTQASITKPRLDVNGIDPVEPSRYGLTEDDVVALDTMNAALERAINAATDAFAASVQQYLGVAHGDLAGSFFSDDDLTRQAALRWYEYAILEIQTCKERVEDLE